MKKVLVICTSLRNKSNSELLADELIEGAVESGNQVEKITLKGKNINFCKGCLACQKLKNCVIKDDSNEIVKKMGEAEAIVFATPIYYYEMSGQMKTLLDRANPLFSTDYKFRDIYLLTTAADEDISTPSKALNGLQGWIDCFPKSHLKGSVFAGGVTSEGSIKDHKSLLEAFKLGQSI